MDWKRKLSSRKFWVSCAAFLGSIATTIGGLATSNEKIAIIGIICGMLSQAIYVVCESRVDAANTTVTTTESEGE